MPAILLLAPPSFLTMRRLCNGLLKISFESILLNSADAYKMDNFTSRAEPSRAEPSRAEPSRAKRTLDQDCRDSFDISTVIKFCLKKS